MARVLARRQYERLENLLQEKRIFFTSDGGSRFRPENTLHFSDQIRLEPYCAFLAGNHLCTCGSFSTIVSPIQHFFSLGRYCSIAKGMTLLGDRHPYEYCSTSAFLYNAKFISFRQFRADQQEGFDVKPQIEQSASIRIGHDVYIEEHVTLKRSLTMGTGALILAHSVVVKDVPPYAIAGGNPATVLGYRFPERIINKLLLSEWWRYRFTDFNTMNIENVEAFLEEIEDAVISERIQPYTPPILTFQGILDVVDAPEES